MRTIAILLIAAGTVAWDGIVMPGLFGIHESVLILAFLVAFILAFGSRRWVIGSGIAGSLLAESLLGLYPGVMALPFLLTVLLWHGLTKFVSIKPALDESSRMFAHVIVGILLLAAFYIGIAIAARVFYGQPLLLIRETAATLPFLAIYETAGVAAYLLMFKFIWRQNDVF